MTVVKKIQQVGRGRGMNLGGREGLSLRSLKNGRKELASKLLSRWIIIFPQAPLNPGPGPRESQRKPSPGQCLSRLYYQGFQSQDRQDRGSCNGDLEGPFSPCHGTHRLPLAKGRGLNPCLLGNLAPVPPPLLKCH